MNNFYKRYPALLGQEKNIDKVTDLIVGCHYSGGKLLLCGNGGSASDCEHWSAELMKDFLFKRSHRNKMPPHDIVFQPGVKAIPLPSLTSICTAVSNDMGSEYIFSQLVYVLANAPDLLVCISTSGTSPNILSAARMAKESIGIKSILLTGSKAPNSKDFDIIVRAPSGITHEIQEYHLAIYHYISAMVEREIWGRE